MTSDYQISLNFLPVVEKIAAFTIFRKLLSTPQESRPREDLIAYRLPENAGDNGDWPSYWVSLEASLGFHQFQATAELKPDLTRRVLFKVLEATTRRILKPEQFHVPDNNFIEEVSFIMNRHPEGDEQLVVQPYYLRTTRQFGYLVDYHFHKSEGVPYSRRVQQLSLSLNKEFRRNLDCYVDRFTKINEFLRTRQDIFSSLHLPGDKNTITLANEFIRLPADRLNPKTYVFASNRESKGQFIGLRDFGPLKPLEVTPKLLFIFREQDRQAARTLALSLRGSNQRTRFTFAGFKSLFKCDLEIDSNPVVLPDLSMESIEDALVRVSDLKKTHPSIIPIVVLPPNDDSYLIQKAIFVHAEIPTQVCTLRVLQDEDVLKYAIANLALQIFCKAGGHPWKVRPTADHSLIIGISQSHKTCLIDGKRKIDKYFAFSVMTDSSGLFQEIQILGEAQNHQDYISNLRGSLSRVLHESAARFSRVVVHTSFKLKHSEIDAIQKTVQEAANSSDNTTCHFAVVKVNHKARFFGINRDVNSLVPYEATRVRLGPGEYLVWFEGIFPNRPTVDKAFPGPTHLQILRTSDERVISDDVLLQDLVNLSGGNWRGFNAKSAPVSTFYCHLVADFVHDFHERKLPLPPVKDIRPWFL